MAEIAELPVGFCLTSWPRASYNASTNSRSMHETEIPIPNAASRVCKNHREFSSAVVNKAIVPCTRGLQPCGAPLSQPIHPLVQTSSESEGSRFEGTARRQPRAAEKIALHDTPQRIGLCRGNIHRETHTLTAGGMVAKVVQRLEEREQWESVGPPSTQKKGLPSLEPKRRKSVRKPLFPHQPQPPTTYPT